MKKCYTFLGINYSEFDCHTFNNEHTCVDCGLIISKVLHDEVTEKIKTKQSLAKEEE